MTALEPKAAARLKRRIRQFGRTVVVRRAGHELAQCERSRLMLAQRTLPQQGNREAEVGAALQQDFRKPAVEAGRIALILNRPFAAPSMNWDDADGAVILRSNQGLKKMADESAMIGLQCK